MPRWNGFYVDAQFDDNGNLHGAVTLYRNEDKTNIYKTIEYLHGIKHGNEIIHNANNQRYIHKQYKNGVLCKNLLFEKGLLRFGKIEIDKEPTFFDMKKNVIKSFDLFGDSSKYDFKIFNNDNTHELITCSNVSEDEFYTKVVEAIINNEYSKESNSITQQQANDGGSGVVEVYYENGTLRWETPYINGKINGVEKEYHENGNLWVERPYKDDLKHGVEKTYLENGKLEWEIPYKDGLKNGVETTYYEDGTLKQERYYNHGTEVSSIDKIEDYAVAIILNNSSSKSTIRRQR